MDVYDFLILDIISVFKKQESSNISLSNLERLFWKRIEENNDLNVGMAKVGERIAHLYLDGYIENKKGYQLTKKGSKELVA